ncbi:hypothetical protein PMAYCL1PPCAC_09525, partial [Pristionchus mayeri]
DKWLVNGSFYHVGVASCGPSKKHGNTAAWFVNYIGDEVEIDIAECTDSYKCTISAMEYNTDCGSANGCSKIWPGDGIRCPVESNLRVKQENGTIINGTMEHLVCNEKTGHWTIEGRKEVEIDKKANIYCE